MNLNAVISQLRLEVERINEAIESLEQLEGSPLMAAAFQKRSGSGTTDRAGNSSRRQLAKVRPKAGGSEF